MLKYLRVENKNLSVLDSNLNTIKESDIKISEEVFNYYLTLFNKEYNCKTIETKEINSIEEFNKYLKDTKEETIIVKQEASENEKQLWNIIEELALQVSNLEDKLASK